MKTENSVDWKTLLEENVGTRRLIQRWSNGDLTTREITDSLAFSTHAGEFRRLVRSSGTTYGRRLARKALKYRGITA